MMAFSPKCTFCVRVVNGPHSDARTRFEPEI